MSRCKNDFLFISGINFDIYKLQLFSTTSSPQQFENNA